jgi:hypothetical protein
MSVLRNIVDKVLVRTKPLRESPAAEPSLLVRPGARKGSSPPPTPIVSDGRREAKTPSVDERSTPALLRAKTRQRN